MKSIAFRKRKSFGLATLLMLSLLLATFPHNAVAINQPYVRSGVPGSYELSFLTNDMQPLIDDTLPVDQELVLKAAVADSFGSPALQGSVTFQVCSLQGGRSLFQMDPGPSSACDVEGTGTWISLTTMKVNAGLCPGTGPGYACVNFGFVHNPRTIGFRCIPPARSD